MDPLSAVIGLLRPHAVLSKPISGRGRWGVRYTAPDMPVFATMLEGRCLLAIDGLAPLWLEAGDFILMPSLPAFEMSSGPGVAPKPGDPAGFPIRHGDPTGDPDMRMLGGGFRIERVNASLVLALLPSVIHVRAADGDTSALSRILAMIKEECDGDLPGGEMVLQRLLEVMLIEALRRQCGRADLDPGLLAGLRDPGIARTLRAIHGDPRARWSVAALAEIAGMSRSAFAARFAQTVGCGPIEYLARWRIELAKERLSRDEPSLDTLADDIGFESASAFSTAFRRRVGSAPRSFARAHRSGADARSTAPANAP